MYRPEKNWKNEVERYTKKFTDHNSLIIKNK